MLLSEKCGGHSWFRTSNMPPGRSSFHAFDINILDQRALDTPDGLDIALRAIEAVCHQGDPGIAGMVAALSSHSHTLEYILSGMLYLAAIGPCASPALTVPPSSAGGGGIRETLEVDRYRVSHTRNAKYDG